MNGLVDNRDREVNLTPLVCQFRKHNPSATSGAARFSLITGSPYMDQLTMPLEKTALKNVNEKTCIFSVSNKFSLIFIILSCLKRF